MNTQPNDDLGASAHERQESSASDKLYRDQPAMTTIAIGPRATVTTSLSLSSSSSSSSTSLASLAADSPHSSPSRGSATFSMNERDHNKNFVETRKPSSFWLKNIRMSHYKHGYQPVPTNGSGSAKTPAGGITTTSTSTTTTSTSKTTAASYTTKYVTWSCRLMRRKQFVGVLAIVLLLLYVNSSNVKDDTDNRIEVLHYSHVPGMKEANHSALIKNAGKLKNFEYFLSNGSPPTFLSTSASASPSVELNLLDVASDKAKSNAIDRNGKNQNKNPIPNAAGIAAAVTAAAVAVTAASAGAAANPTAANFASAAVTPTIGVNHPPNTSSVNLTNISLPILPSAVPPFEHPIVDIIANNNNTSPADYVDDNMTTPPPGYLVWSESCKMPNIDPYQAEVMKYFERGKYTPCSTLKPLTRVEYNDVDQRYVLRINQDAMSSYTKSPKMQCCYQAIERNSTGVNADKDISLSECIHFQKSTKLSPTIDNILVKCHVKKKQVYINGHAMMPDRPEIRQRLADWKSHDKQNHQLRPPSVLMIGIDSISRINLIRAMPKTAQYLYDKEWFEMSGYNKMDDNTFPNLMAVLTGRNRKNALSKCPPTVLNGLDKCNFIWHTFRDHGYVTAYGEDEASINTFNYLKVGFERPPVDYYLRPFLLGAEKHLAIKRKSNLAYCLGYQHSAEFVYDYAVELATRYKREPFFGLFWTNTFSHNAISDCSSMDERMVVYLKKFEALGTLDNTIVIFFSDHGMRYGPTRKTLSGHLEERLPFMFMWMPPHIKQAHPEFVNALNVNKNRLTNPYDLHMTLKHILAMTHRVENKTVLQPALDCPRCQTLLEPVPHDRSCQDAAIEEHWCTCIPYESVYKNSKTVQKLAKATVGYINDFVSTFRNGTYKKLCTTLQYKSVDKAYRSQSVFTGIASNSSNNSNNNDTEIYRIIFSTKPNNALFEATIRYHVPTGGFNISGEISRLNSYSSDSECVEDGAAKKYCSCRKKKLF